MRIHCPACRRPYDFPTELLADSPFRACCVGCRARFSIGPAGVDPPVPPAPPPPAARTRQPEPPPEVEGPVQAGYLELRGADARMAPPRRRVVLLGRPHRPGGAPQYRVVSLPANFGRPRRRAPEATPAVAAATAPAQPAPPAPDAGSGRLGRSRLLPVAALVLGACLGAGLLALDRARRRPAPPEPEPPPAAATVHLPGGVRVDGLHAMRLPAPARALLVEGFLINDAPDPAPDLVLEATLSLGGTPRRRREVGCCSVLEVPEAARAANRADHPHFAPAATRPSAVLAPGEERRFSVVFPALTEDLLTGDPEVEVRVRRVRTDTAPAP